MAPQTDAAAVRRRLHRYPEPYWREFHTTSIVVEELERAGVDEIYVGPDALAVEERLGVPDDADLEAGRDRAEREGARADVLEATEDGATGAVGVVRRGEGPTVGLRADIDGLAAAESADGSRRPAAEGFRSEHEGLMHASGHDATIGIGALERVAVPDSDFRGTFELFFQEASTSASRSSRGRPPPSAGTRNRDS